MIKIKKSIERGHADHGWLKSYHSFSFADYYDRNNMHFQTLRVINEDFVAPNRGFDTHQHKDMEIVTYVLSGQLAHNDSMGNSKVIYAGEFQAMTAGSGITHSEFNPSATETVHLLQIWIMPEKKLLSPSYAEFKPEVRDGLSKIVSKTGPLKINQDVELYLGRLANSKNIEQKINKNRHLWIQQIEGVLELNNIELSAGDSAAISEENLVILKAKTDSHFLLFDLNQY